MEADLHRFYGVDLDLDPGGDPPLWALRGKVSVRWLLRRLRHIPHGQGAAILTIDGPEWSIEADIADTHRRSWENFHTDDQHTPALHWAHPARRAEDDGTPDEAAVAYAMRLAAEREAELAAAAAGQQSTMHA